jgi:hypothetical protein
MNIYAIININDLNNVDFTQVGETSATLLESLWMIVSL